MAPHGSERVSDLLAPVVQDSGLVLEGVSVSAAGKRRVVRVVVDLPDDATDALDLDTVADVSRAVSDALDGSDALGGSPYVLEVTSPGVDRPLTERRHWSRARGRLVVATVTDDSASSQASSDVTGRVVAVTDDGVTLDTDGDKRLLPWPTLGRGAVQVEFNRTAADGDAAGTEAQET